MKMFTLLVVLMLSACASMAPDSVVKVNYAGRTDFSTTRAPFPAVTDEGLGGGTAL